MGRAIWRGVVDMWAFPSACENELMPFRCVLGTVAVTFTRVTLHVILGGGGEVKGGEGFSGRVERIEFFWLSLDISLSPFSS